MKSKTNQLAILYIIIALFVAVAFHKFSFKNYSLADYQLYNLSKDLVIVFVTGFTFRYILSNNDNKNKATLEKLTKTNEEIKESNEKYDIVAKATSDTIWDWKIQEDKLIWKEGIKSIFGYEQEEVGDTSKWWFDNIHPEDSVKMSIKLYSFLEQKTENWQDEYRFKCADNSYKYVLNRGFLLKDSTGKAVRMIGAIQDITKQKEEELRLKLLETVIIQTKDSIMITEANSNERTLPKIVYVNPSFSAMTGYASYEMIGKSPDLLGGINSAKHSIKKIMTALRSRNACVIEVIAYTKSQVEFWLRFSMIPIYNSEKELSHWVSIQKDVSEEKRQEKEKEHLIRELTQNNKDLKQFSYITSHNLRAPLSNLTGLLHLLEDIPIIDRELKEILHGFNKSTHLLNETINDLTKVMVIKDNASIQKEVIELKEILENAFHQLTLQINTYKPLVIIDFESAQVLEINKSYIESILLNLMTNCIKYKSENKKLEISVSSYQDANHTTLLCRDDGIGIDLKRNKDKVFGLYQRFHNYPDSKGLGLYLVKSQVEAMGRRISIESEVDKGTTFTLTFKNK